VFRVAVVQAPAEAWHESFVSFGVLACIFVRKTLGSRHTGLARQGNVPAGKRCCRDAARHRRLYRVH
jgi:hypothetical protein